MESRYGLRFSRLPTRTHHCLGEIEQGNNLHLSINGRARRGLPPLVNVQLARVVKVRPAATRIVFETALDMSLPVAWNLAGGYQRDAEGGIAPVLEIHRNTMKECISVYVR